MMKRIATAAAFLTVLGISAQNPITITDADMPFAGDSVRVSIAATTGNVDHTLTGTAYLWDFSSLVPNAQQMYRFRQPTTFPFAALANVAYENYSPDTLPVIGGIPSNFTDYYKRSASSYKQVGSSFEYQQLIPFPIPIIYSSQDYIYRLPMNSGDQDSCHASYSFTIPGLGYIGQERDRRNNVDGWGILITPFDTFQTLRVKTIIDAVDTISFDTTNQTGFTIVRPQVVQYKWFANGMSIPVLQVEAQVLLNNEVVTNVTYQDSLRNNVFQVGISEYSAFEDIFIYPNPAQEQLNILMPSGGKGKTLLTFFNAGGQIVRKEQFSDFQTNIQIQLNGFDEGVYFVRIDNGVKVFVKKFIVIK